MLFRNCGLDYVKSAEVESSDSSKDSNKWGETGGLISKFPDFISLRYRLLGSYISVCVFPYELRALESRNYMYYIRHVIISGYKNP